MFHFNIYRIRTWDVSSLDLSHTASQLQCTDPLLGRTILSIIYRASLNNNQSFHSSTDYYLNYSTQRGNHIGLGWFSCRCSIIVKLELDLHSVGFCQTGALCCRACVNVLECFVMSIVDFVVVFLKGQAALPYHTEPEEKAVIPME